jgi:hypothetical protein
MLFLQTIEGGMLWIILEDYMAALVGSKVECPDAV